MIRYMDRLTKKEEVEKVYGHAYIKLLYGSDRLSGIFAFFFLALTAHISFFSKLYGMLQKSPLSRSKVQRFIRDFNVDETEFLEPAASFSSFNDFFIRKLKPSARPIVQDETRVILPADARYLVYANMEQSDGFLVKGQKFSLDTLLQNAALSDRYRKGSLVIARLCPVDYHRFHFPCDGTPEIPQAIDGPLYSVNPLALKKNIQILAENKRMITPFHTKNFGTILYIEVGATYVGTIHQTFTPEKPYKKGDEKGYFSFGGSSLLLLFEPGRIQLDQDLLDASATKIEMRGLLGQSLGEMNS